ERKGKNLWTSAGDGEKIVSFTAESETEEALFIADEIATDVANGRKFSDHAVLYRTNAQSNPIERAFVRMSIPYRVIGGKRFYERKEIRDALAYLAVINNPSDNVKLRRIINEPKRGIGDTTVNNAAEIAAGLGISLYEVLSDAEDYDRLSRAAAKLHKFISMMDRLRARAEEIPMYDFFDELMDQTGYLQGLTLDKETYQERLDNLQELKSNMKRYLEENEEGDLGSFLEEVSLLSDIDAYNDQSDVAILMTLHAAKGLEFPVVFISGMEEGIFPGRQSMYDSSEVEEERRLAYVGITRAKEKLYLTNAATRMLFGSTTRNPASRFLSEIPEEYIAEPPTQPSIYAAYTGRKQGYQKGQSFLGFGGYGSASYSGSGYGVSEKAYRSGRAFAGDPSDKGFASSHKIGAKEAMQKGAQKDTNSYKIGDTVKHKAFGTGVVLSVTPMGNDLLLEIAFDRAGTKKVMANFAKLEKSSI
ncbi:MAG TPA: 3'-5' exonuclease, partial [Clostridiales bacterium]|nr:3'-5' exonuclease [Clostridiales bacterium]